MHLRLLPLLLLALAGPAHARQEPAAAPTEPPQTEPPPTGASAEDAASDPGEGGEGAPELAPPELPPETAPVAPEGAPLPQPLAPYEGAAHTAPEEVRPLRAERITDARLEQAFATWHRSLVAMDWSGAEKAQAALLALQRDAGITSLEPFSASFLRAAAHRREAGDVLQAVALAQAAVTLAPELPEAHLGLAHAYLAADPGAPARALVEAWRAGDALLRRPASARATLANAGAVVLLALVATCTLVAGVLFLRRARLFLHDLHHVFPRLASRWQSAAFGLLLLSLPGVLRLGLLPSVLALLLAVSLSLGRAERAVAAVLVAVVAWVPWASGQLVERTSFAGTSAEAVWTLEEGGLGAEAVAEAVEARRHEGRASAVELHALGRFHARRGDFEPAVRVLQAAAEQREPDARLLTHMGNVLFATGNLEGAAELYLRAIQADGSLAAPLYNLGILRQRRAERMPQGAAVEERSRADEVRNKALELDPTLAGRPAPAEVGELANRVLVSAPLPAGEVLRLAAAPEEARAVAQQLSVQLVGAAEPVDAGLLGLLGALLVLAGGGLSGRLSASRACTRCGGAACRRCDREVSAAGAVCSQCLHTFLKKGAVPPQARARKLLEVERHRTWQHRVASTLALLVSGAGHLYSGRPVRGSLYAFLFLAGLGAVVFHRGLVRVPHADATTALLVLAPLAPLLLAVHLLSVRAQLRRSTHD